MRWTLTDSDAEAGGSPSSRRWLAVLVDLVLVAAWVAAISVAWGVLGWTDWTYYVTVFGGIATYSLLAPSL